jgi:hypothetical protein
MKRLTRRLTITLVVLGLYALLCVAMLIEKERV